ncbi:MFS transporter, partial [Pedobacter sp.]|uniref:MFS transporter n=1 Tax=Pedobacter sp. TaxID=1411316 RepID=UPI003C6756B9
MQSPLYVRPWLTTKAIGLQLIFFLILLSAVFQFAAFALNQNAVISWFGAQAEDITLALQLSYIGILVTLPIQFRLIKYFEFRNYLSVSIAAGILLNILCIHVSDLLGFFIIRFLQGVIVCTVAGSMLTMIVNYLKSEFKKVVAPMIFYGTILSSGVLIGLVFATVSLNSDWKEIYYYLIGVQVLALILAVITFNGASGFKKFPLYQIDWIGSLFFICAAVSMAYTWIYGSKYYWFEDQRIWWSTAFCLACMALYLWRSSLLKRPLISLSAFKVPKFWVGLLLFALYYGIKESLNLIFGYAANILQWAPSEIMNLGLMNVAGLLTFMVLATRLILKKLIPLPSFLFGGFTLMLLYHIWVYHNLTPDLSFWHLALPMFLQGAASGLLFVPLLAFTLGSIPTSTGGTGAVVAAYLRFITLLNVSAGFYNLQLYYNQMFKEGFLRHTAATDLALSDRISSYRQMFISKGIPVEQAEKLAQVNIAKTIGMQTQLLSTRAIFLSFTWVLSVILIIMTLLLIAQLIKKKLRGLGPD